MNHQPSQLLDQQLDFLDQQSNPDRWQHDHETAMFCRDAEDLIALALETLDRVRKRRDSLAPELMLGYFRRWHAISLKALACLEWIEREGFHLDHADDFRFAINEASIALNFDRVAAAQARLNAGQGRELDEILDGLSPHA